MSREHLAVALALGIPLAVAITKSDLAPEGAVQQAAEEIRWASSWVGAGRGGWHGDAAGTEHAGMLACATLGMPAWQEHHPDCSLRHPGLQRLAGCSGAAGRWHLQ